MSGQGKHLGTKRGQQDGWRFDGQIKPESLACERVEVPGHLPTGERRANKPQDVTSAAIRLGEGDTVPLLDDRRARCPEAKGESARSR